MNNLYPEVIDILEKDQFWQFQSTFFSNCIGINIAASWKQYVFLCLLNPLSLEEMWISHTCNSTTFFHWQLNILILKKTKFSIFKKNILWMLSILFWYWVFPWLSPVDYSVFFYWLVPLLFGFNQGRDVWLADESLVKTCMTHHHLIKWVLLFLGINKGCFILRLWLANPHC